MVTIREIRFTLLLHLCDVFFPFVLPYRNRIVGMMNLKFGFRGLE
uniref:Uncharacterized protein n=1 Tax=Rhizophora mucronata TaxID=61149 RepID=A0A2P2JSG5_RHIMU